MGAVLNDYLREPHFEGGIWRYCAVHCGGLEALAEEARRHILRRGQSDDPHQRARFAELTRAGAHGAAVGRRGLRGGGRAAAGGLRTQSLLARGRGGTGLPVRGSRLTERIMGTAPFRRNAADADRIRRDLAYLPLRQANLDGKRGQGGSALLSPRRTRRPVGEAFS